MNKFSDLCFYAGKALASLERDLTSTDPVLYEAEKEVSMTISDALLDMANEKYKKIINEDKVEEDEIFETIDKYKDFISYVESFKMTVNRRKHLLEIKRDELLLKEKLEALEKYFLRENDGIRTSLIFFKQSKDEKDRAYKVIVMLKHLGVLEKRYKECNKELLKEETRIKIEDLFEVVEKEVESDEYREEFERVMGYPLTMSGKPPIKNETEN